MKYVSLLIRKPRTCRPIYDINVCLSPEDDQSILIETSSCNLQFFSELITTQLRDFHMVSPQVAFPYLSTSPCKATCLSLVHDS